MKQTKNRIAKAGRAITQPVEYEYWADRIRLAINEPDPAQSNRMVTEAHFCLSNALREVIGEETGANFHSWAVWGSRKAGVTIRQEDLDKSIRDGAVVAGVVGMLVAVIGGLLVDRKSQGVSRASWAAGLAAGSACGALAGWGLAVDSRSRASRLILAGNRTVLEEIGLLTARFLARFANEPSGDPEILEEFLLQLKPGLTESGGQDLLRRTFACYHAARYGRELKARQEAAYFANCLAVYHEHIRLQPYIEQSLPHIIRKCVTKRMMTYDVGDLRFAVGHDVPALNGLSFPAHLQQLENEDLVRFLAGPEGWEMSLDSLKDTAAKDWTKIRERMGYVFALFRALHVEPSVLRAPYTQGDAPVLPILNRNVRLGTSVQ
jgi:hypothetical protein